MPHLPHPLANTPCDSSLSTGLTPHRHCRVWYGSTARGIWQTSDKKFVGRAQVSRKKKIYLHPGGSLAEISSRVSPLRAEQKKPVCWPLCRRRLWDPQRNEGDKRNNLIKVKQHAGLCLPLLRARASAGQLRVKQREK